MAYVVDKGRVLLCVPFLLAIVDSEVDGEEGEQEQDGHIHDHTGQVNSQAHRLLSNLAWISIQLEAALRARNGQPSSVAAVLIQEQRVAPLHRQRSAKRKQLSASPAAQVFLWRELCIDFHCWVMKAHELPPLTGMLGNGNATRTLLIASAHLEGFCIPFGCSSDPFAMAAGMDLSASCVDVVKVA